jgi:phosphatidylserine/phosphatidylglycerophosphate/cardiolipin synthase-like enzyme
MADKDFFVNIGTSRKAKNCVYPLVNGEEAWIFIKGQLALAKKSIHLCFWVLESDLELIREPKDTFKEPRKRNKYTLYYILNTKAKDGVKVRILLWQIPVVPHSVYDFKTRISGQIGHFEVMYQPHPTKTIGSWHQKTIIIDDDIAFVGGMNAKENDWDTSAHKVYDYRRTRHNTSAGKRKKMKTNIDLPDFLPKHDYMTYIKGQIVTDVQANFVERWNYCISQKYTYYQNATKLAKPKLTSGFGNIPAQITRTIPAYKPQPAGERGIFYTYRKAIALAKNYIYIENQYFRSQLLAADIARACKKNRKLRVIVVTPPDYLNTLEQEDFWKVATFSSYWTKQACHTIRSAMPDFCLFYLQMSALDKKKKRQFFPIDLHAKIMIVDDEWYTIGSCNINDRGFLYDGEMNVSVQHSSAKELRIKAFTQHLETKCPDKIEDAIKLWIDHAKKNHIAWKNKKKPVSRVYPFNQNGPLLPIIPSTWL